MKTICQAQAADQVTAPAPVREAKELALLIVASCPPSQERSKALTDLRQAVQWANASIAINQ